MSGRVDDDDSPWVFRPWWPRPILSGVLATVAGLVVAWVVTGSPLSRAAVLLGLIVTAFTRVAYRDRERGTG